jgi:hypothetical protein
VFLTTINDLRPRRVHFDRATPDVRKASSRRSATAAVRRAGEQRIMTITLKKRGFELAKQLIRARRCVLDVRGDWSDHRPARTAENRFIADHGWAEFGKWHLAEDDEIPEHNKSRYKFPFGDFKAVHRCAVLAAESRAGQYKYTEVELAAAHLHGMLDELIPDSAASGRQRVSPH